MTRKHKSKNKVPTRGIYYPNPGTHDSVQYRYVSTARTVGTVSLSISYVKIMINLSFSLCLSRSLAFTHSVSLFVCLDVKRHACARAPVRIKMSRMHAYRER